MEAENVPLCTTCGKNPQSKYSHKCVECLRKASLEWYYKNKEKRLAYLKRKRETMTREERELYNRTARRRHKERMETDPEYAARMRARAKAYRLAHLEQYAAYSREHRKRRKQEKKHDEC